MKWSEMAATAPALANRGISLLIDPGVVLVGTVRQDGTARISPVEPLIWNGDLWLSMMLGSTKATDLLRDDRILVHIIVTNRDGETGGFKVRGRGIHVQDEGTTAGYAAAVAGSLGWQPVPGQFRLFRVDLREIVSIRYENGDQYVTRWPAGRETVRRKITPTSLGDPEPVIDLLGSSPDAR